MAAGVGDLARRTSFPKEGGSARTPIPAGLSRQAEARPPGRRFVWGKVALVRKLRPPAGQTPMSIEDITPVARGSLRRSPNSPRTLIKMAQNGLRASQWSLPAFGTPTRRGNKMRGRICGTMEGTRDSPSPLGPVGIVLELYWRLSQRASLGHTRGRGAAIVARGSAAVSIWSGC